LKDHSSRPVQAKQFIRTHLSEKKAGCGDPILSLWGVPNKKIAVQAGLGNKARSYLQNNQSKRAGGMSQAGEHLPSKRKALSSKTPVLLI
jgi:hypothetical protein